MSTEYIAAIGAIATVLAGFGGAALGAYFAYKTGMKLVQKTHKNDVELMRRQEFNKAATDFRMAFIPEIVYLKHNAKVKGTESTNNLCEFLRSGYISRHLVAFEAFRRHLPPGKQKEFDETWEEYCHYDIEGEPKSPFFEQYYEDIWEGQPTKDLALQRINKLLSFSEFVK
jgi:hypothetical protein